MDSSEQDIPPYFGKYQRAATIAYYNLLYLTFYFVIGHIIYAILSLNYTVIGFYAIVIILQETVRKNQAFIYFANNIIQVRKGLKQVTVTYEEQISQTEKCLFGFHPHGVLAVSVLVYMNLNNGPFKRMVGMASRCSLCVPFAGIILRLWGVQGVQNSNMKRLMQKGQNIGLVPGGYEEATLTVPHELRIYIKQRKGFIKYALQQNYTIYPVLSLNQFKVFSTFPYLLNLRLWLNKFKVPAVLYWNTKSGVFLPTDIQFSIVVGKGIRGRTYLKGEKPTNQEVDQAHAKYIAEIIRIHQKYKELNQLPLKIY